MCARAGGHTDEGHTAAKFTSAESPQAAQNLAEAMGNALRLRHSPLGAGDPRHGKNKRNETKKKIGLAMIAIAACIATLAWWLSPGP